MKQSIKKVLMAILSVLCVGTMIFAVACGEEKKPDNKNSSEPTVSSPVEDSSNGGQSSQEQSSQEQSSQEQSSSSGGGEVDPVGEITITFDPNGGTMTGEKVFPIDSEGYLDGDPANPTKDGFKFVGWYTAKEDGDLVDLYDEFTASATFYAHWAEEITITFDPNGGELVGNATAKIAKGTTISNTPSATKEGLEFYGWYTEADGGVEVNFTTYKPEANATLYARFGYISMHIKNLNSSIDESKLGYRIEAEECKFVGTPSQDGANIIETAAAASGGQSLGYLGTVGNQLIFTFYAETAGKAKIALRCASNNYTISNNWSVTNTDQNVDNSVISVTFNGEDAAFPDTYLRGSNTSTFNLYFDPILFGELDIIQGVNSLVVTGLTQYFPNTDCLDIETTLVLKSANGDAASGTATSEGIDNAGNQSNDPE